MSTIKPPRLNPGDTIGLVSPSWFGGASVLHRIENGAACLRDMGYQVRIAPHALNDNGYVSDSAENRAADLNHFFADPDIKAIIATIGGDHSCHLLPLLDYDAIRSHPKILMGFSDMTVLNIAIWVKTGLVTFNGPAVMTDFGEFPTILDYTKSSFLKTVAAAEPVGKITPAPQWTEEFLDWETRADLTRPRMMNPNPGWTWLKHGQAEGVLIGGCLESMQHLRGTPYWPKHWHDSILFFETSEEKPEPPTVDSCLMDYENMGVLEQIKGLLVGRPYGYSAQETAALHQVILDRCSKYPFPILTQMDFGHTSPMFTLPVGIRARIDSVSRSFLLCESAVS